MNRVIDNKYVFKVQKNIQREIEKRSTCDENDGKKCTDCGKPLGKGNNCKQCKLSRIATSPIGYGPVLATITKDSSQAIMRMYKQALAEITPLATFRGNNKEEEEEEDDPFYNFFGDEEETPKKEELPKKRKRDFKTEYAQRKDVKKDVDKRIETFKLSKTNANTNMHVTPMIATYFDKCKKDLEYGCVGVVPTLLHKLPDTISEFAATPVGQVLTHFCKINKLE